MSAEFCLLTALSKEECVARLRNRIGHESLDLSRLSIHRGSEPFVGEVLADKFVLRKRISGRNSFQTFASGSMRSTESGTLINVRFSAHPGLYWGYAGWGCCMVFIAVPIVMHLLHALSSGAAHWRDLGGPDYQTEVVGLLMLCFFPLLFGIGRVTASGEDEALYSFLKQTLEARYA